MLPKPSIATLARMTMSLCSSAPVMSEMVTRTLSGTRNKAENCGGPGVSLSSSSTRCVASHHIEG